MTTARLFIMCAAVLLSLASCAPAQPITPTPIPAEPTPFPTYPSLITSRIGSPLDIEPSAADEQEALRAVGGRFIGIVACTLGTEYHATVANEAKKRAESAGLRAEIFDSMAEADTQAGAVRDFVERGAAAIIICVLDPQMVGDAVWQASNSGVAIVQYAGRDSSAHGISVSIEEADLGCAAGTIAGDAINAERGGEATVAILDYPDIPAMATRSAAIEKCLKGEAPRATVLCCYLGGTPENGRTSMEAALATRPDIDAVVSINDAGAYGAIEALSAAGKDGRSTIVVGIDGEARAREMTVRGDYFRGTVDTNPALTGQMAANGAIMLLAGKSVPKSVKVPVNPITPDSMPTP
jgi:ABC-type sugar transport system substrate-binding protein